jgi:hypothetical protein
MWEQVNMLSDPVVGLARRPGSVWLAETDATTAATLTPQTLADLTNYREYTFFVRGKEYCLLYQVTPSVAGDQLQSIFVLNKDDGKFLNVVNPNPTYTAPWLTGGIAAVTTVGDYVCMAALGMGPGYSTADNYAASNTQGIAWVRGGAYSRTFTVTAKHTNGVMYSGSYTTLASSYPTLLNTSDIPQGATDYQKQVNDRVNAYNSAVNAWIGQAATSVQPQSIANGLVASLRTNGFPAGDVGQVGGTMVFSHITSLGADDGGDGTLFRPVFNTVDDPAKLSSVHSPNKTVQIQSKGAPDPYYMKFIADNPASASWQTGTWIEAPAQTVTPGQVFMLGGISSDGNDFVIGAAADLNGAKKAGVSYGFNAPGFSVSRCGDLTATGAVPYFFGKQISMLTMFQDRLVIVANGTIFMSKAGDYFNFFRDTMLSVHDDDPIEVYALGAADDVISRSVTFNKDLFMFGKRNQYVISGRQMASPQTISVSTTAAERDATNAQPVTNGNLIFYGKARDASDQVGGSPYAGQLNQFQLGLFQDTPETYQISKQLDKYMRGQPIELAALSAPATLFVRTDGYTSGFYVYSYIDSAGSQQRAWDSWSRWEVSPSMGTLVGMTAHRQTLIALFVTPNGAVGHNTKYSLMAVSFSLDAKQSGTAYLDGLRPLSQATGSIAVQFPNRATASMWSDCYAAVDVTKPEFLFHTPLTDWDTFAAPYLAKGYTTANFQTGWDYSSYVTITAPYVRDQNDKAITTGRLTVQRYAVSVTDTAGMDTVLTAAGTDTTVAKFNGRILGWDTDMVGVQPVATTTISVPAGRANTEHRVTFKSRTCLPMSISAIEWVGQFFSNSRRV